MERRFRHYHANISFIDLLFNTILGFAFLFAISFALLRIHELRAANITTKAEFIVTLTWDSESKDDVDLWIKDPDGRVMFFRTKATGLMHLDRDDLGKENDEVITAEGRHIIVDINQEIGTIRGFISGEWIINVHMYNKRDINPTNVTVKIEKLNPSVQLVALKKFMLSSKNEEVTVARINMDSDGKILTVDDMFEPLTSRFLLLQQTPSQEEVIAR